MIILLYHLIPNNSVYTLLFVPVMDCFVRILSPVLDCELFGNKDHASFSHCIP